MKKNYLFVAGLASMMAFSACSNDDDLAVPATPVVENDGTMFEIAISTAGEGAETRTVRPVGSSGAANNVNEILVKMYAKALSGGGDWEEQDFEIIEADDAPTVTTQDLAAKLVGGESGVTLSRTTDNKALKLTYTNKDVSEGTPGTTQHLSKKATIQLGGMKDKHQYKFVTYGYNDKFPGNPTAASSSFETGVFEANQEYTEPADAYKDIEEVFATSYIANTTIVTDDFDNDGVKDDTKVVFTVAPTLTLTRQVAGMLAYFENVPTYVNGEQVYKVQIVANHRADDFYFPSCLLEDDDFNGIMDASANEDILMTFDMENIAVNFAEGTNDPFYLFNTLEASTAKANPANSTSEVPTAAAVTTRVAPVAEGYSPSQIAENSQINGLNLLPNTMFGGRYILPYDKHYATPTLRIEFINKEGKAIPEASKYITTDQSMVDAYDYDIRCNNFYSIGDKDESDNTDGDDPLNLSGDEFKLRIDDRWGVIHSMDVDNNN